MFIIELDKVSTLTQARFAAGEGFTHVCFDLAEMEARNFDFKAIRDFLSGVRIGVWAGEEGGIDLGEFDYIKERVDPNTAMATAMRPEDSGQDFMVVSALPKNQNEIKCVLSVNEEGLTGQETIASRLDDLCGISLLAPPEQRTGFIAVSDPLRDFLDLLEERNLKYL